MTDIINKQFNSLEVNDESERDGTLRRDILKATGLSLGGVMLGFGVSPLQAAENSRFKPGNEPIQPPEHNPSSEYVFSIIAHIDSALTVGDTAQGQIRAIPITGGTVEGENINGIVIPGGADWQLSRADGVTEIEATYAIQVGESTLVKVVNKGIIVPPSSPDEEVYFRTHVSFDAPVGEFDWLNQSIFLCKAGLHPELERTVLVEVFRLL